MTQLGEAITRYHKILEGGQYQDLSWAHQLQERMKANNLAVSGRPVSPVLRPHFITRRQYAGLSKAVESFSGAMERIEKMAIASPALLSRMELLPAEKMLASVDVGYPFLSVTSLIDTHLNNGTVRFARYVPDTPVGVAYGEALSDLFYDAPPVRSFRKRYHLEKLPGTKYLLQAILKAYKEWDGKSKKPNIAILEFRQPFQTAESGESALIAQLFRREGHQVEVVSPDQLEYRNGVLRRGEFPIELIFRRIKVQEFLVRFDLTHPLLRAYQDRAVCLVNSFRSELAQKKAIFDLLTDEEITGSFPAAERRAIQELIPWTRVVRETKTRYHKKLVDLPGFILRNRQKLVLRPNDEGTDQHSFRGSEVDDAVWEKALRTALRNPYVVQEVVEPVIDLFPVLQDGQLEMQRMRVEVHPHSYMGKVQGCSSWLTAVGPSGFSTLSGVAPTFILEPK
ncbi:MAG TPA: hypothetical protein VEV17_03670 [Bryobacteraceae bacterium]|nr:hypothetical protein [Bryobacteraceae bacterium]